MSPLFIILTCLFVWGIAWGVFGYFLLLRGVNYVSRYVTTTFYFLAIGAGMATVFWRTLEPFLCPVNQTSLLILISFMLAQFLLYIRLSRTTFANSEYLTLYPMREYLFFNPRRLLSKSADILVQQIFIVLMIASLNNLGLSILQTTIWFGVLFALIHIAPITREWGKWPAWAFSGAVIIFSAIFPVVILTVHYGFVYTFIIHWLFYTGTAICFWLLRAHKTG